MSSGLIDIAVFAPLRKTFYYRPPSGYGPDDIRVGARVRVPFGNSSRVGVVLGPVLDPQTTGAKIKEIEEVLDIEPLFTASDLAIGQWASTYYHHPLGDVFATMIPTLLRRGKQPELPSKRYWSRAGSPSLTDLPKRATRQIALLDFIGDALREEADFDSLEFDWRRPLNELHKKNWVERHLISTSERDCLNTEVALELNDEQLQVVETIVQSLNTFASHLLHGVTGSGKTNVYMGVINQAIAAGGQALVLLPEIAITQHLVERFEKTFGKVVSVTHSSLSDKQRMQVWTEFQQGNTRILLGTRSAVWTNAENLRCIIVDEEHDPSFKQQEGFRYNARDVAVVRARRLDIPIILGSATPSFESYQNAVGGKYQLLELPNRAGGAQMPSIRIEDIRGISLRAGLSQQLIAAVKERLRRKEQTILFLNRRGYAPVMLCHNCGHVVECTRCDTKLVFHREKGYLSCHQCDKRISIENVPQCCDEQEMIPIGQGTEQLEESLNVLFPEAVVARIDRDTVRKKQQLDTIFSQVNSGEIDILLGTQMLAKGHDFPNVTLVGIVDADGRLFSLDFRAEERLAQLIVQVAGRAGRAALPGEVYVQTRQPFHWLFKSLVEQKYADFLHHGLSERRDAGLPPFANVALIRAEAVKQESPRQFLRDISQALQQNEETEVQVFGPVPSLLERRAGKYRADLMFSAPNYRALARVIYKVVNYVGKMPAKRNVRWSLDVDPQDI